MHLTAEQLWRVATVYEKAAADTVGVPAPQSAAFARKVQQFRTLARIAAKIEAMGVAKQAPTLEPRQSLGEIVRGAANLQCAPKS